MKRLIILFAAIAVSITSSFAYTTGIVNIPQGTYGRVDYNRVVVHTNSIYVELWASDNYNTNHLPDLLENTYVIIQMETENTNFSNPYSLHAGTDNGPYGVEQSLTVSGPDYFNGWRIFANNGGQYLPGETNQCGYRLTFNY